MALTLRSLVAALAALATVSGACAQSVEEFYKKTQLSVYVGSGAGGGFDEIARVFSVHFARHLPGQPSPIVKNMPGAGGLLNVNFMYAQAPRDGSAIAAPFNTLQDASKREVQVGATGVNATPAIFSNMMNTLFGTRFKVISGYTTNEMRFALERGETEGVCGLAWQTYKAVQPGWVENKLIRPIAQMGLVKNRDLPDVPLAIEMLKDPVERKVFELVVLPQEFGRPFIAPPGVPADRAAAMIKAFSETLTDPAFIADAAKIRLSLDPLTGEEIMRLLDEAHGAPKDVIDRAAKFSVVN